ncbi:IGHMBP2, partial [Symbiodinium sp. KB8]
DELTNTATVVIAIITVCGTHSVVARLEFGTMAVYYSILVCGYVVIMVALALDGPWYILYVIVLPSECLHTGAFAQVALGNRRPNDGKGANPSCVAAGGIGMTRGAIWLESMGTAEFNFTNT